MPGTDSPTSSSVMRALVPALVAVFAIAAFLVAGPAADAAAAPAPWFGPNVHVNGPPAYTAYQPSIAAGPNNDLYLAFGGWGGSTTQSDIFFCRSTDGGRTWSTPVRVNNDAGSAAQSDPSLVLDGSSNIYIAWTDTRGGTSDVWFSKSTDGGLSFSANVRINDVTTNFQVEPDVVVDGSGLVHAIWTDNRNALSTGPDIYYANSTDGGLSFNPSRRVNNDGTGAEQARSTIAVAPDRSVYAAWDDPRNGARGRDIYFSKSTDLGNTWTPNIIVNDDSGGASQDNVAMAVDASGSIFVAWADSRNPNTTPDIYATRSTNAGSSFAANVKVNDESGAVFQSLPSIAAIAGKVQLAWIDSRTWGSTGFDIYSASSADGLLWYGNVRVNDDAIAGNDQWTPTVAIGPTGDVFVAWTDERVTTQDVFAAFLDVHLPVANAGGDRTVGQGVSIGFDGSASTDNLGIASYAWDFGGGAVVSGPTVSRAYPTPGTYAATLTVWDFSGNADSETVTLTILDTEAPVARGGGDRTVDEDQALFFDASASTDNVGVASYLWDFGDGNISTSATATHVYGQPGTYDVTLTVRDAAGNADLLQMTVTVRDVSPEASELLAMIRALQALVGILEAVLAVLGIALAIVGFLVLTMRRRQQRPPAVPARPAPPAQAPPSTPPKEPELPPPESFNL